jgi:hypothetical protein
VTKLVKVSTPGGPRYALARTQMKGKDMTLQMSDGATFYQSTFKAPLGSEAWTCTFKEAFQAPGSSSHLFKFWGELGQRGRLEWCPLHSATHSLECDLEVVTGTARDEVRKEFERVAPAFCVTDPNELYAQIPNSEMVPMLETMQSHARDRRAVVTACAKLLQSRVKLINNLQQQLQFSGKQTTDADVRGMIRL